MHHEIALRTEERPSPTPGHPPARPVGSTVVCISDHIKRRKWLEICCDLVSDDKRGNYHDMPPWWDRLCEAWTQDLWDAWFAADRPTEEHKLGRLLMDKAYPQTVWQDLIVPIGVLAEMPLAPDSDVPVFDTWLWSAKERARYLIVIVDDTDDETVESWYGAEDRDADTGEVLPELSEGEVRDPSINVASVWRKQIRYYATDFGLSAGTLADIANPNKVMHPRFDKPVPSSKAVRPSLPVEAI